MPPASPFTASPFDLVINPGQRANGPVRLGYTPPSGARDCDWQNKMESPDGALWKPLEGRPMPLWLSLHLSGSHQPSKLRPTG
ncbi:hypothetical protein THARTR1_02093 [Trichoderma harzianum]|uniref:Uncharacterized protein n=1 Tax=Trichoderma harzianum TaxID=5544 RepID=A0A2K0UJL5_TRIHA|nr:hypothetical protein THARTR1_02093 [Trichoderma harzianum]